MPRREPEKETSKPFEIASVSWTYPPRSRRPAGSATKVIPRLSAASLGHRLISDFKATTMPGRDSRELQVFLRYLASRLQRAALGSVHLRALAANLCTRQAPAVPADV